MSAAVPPSHPQLAVSAAIFREDKILLVRRARSPAKGFIRCREAGSNSANRCMRRYIAKLRKKPR